MAKRRVLKQDELGIDYFFLYPFGHLGFTAVTFFTVFPLTQVMVTRFLAGELAVGEHDGIIAGMGEGLGFAVGV
jgi:hypothetical protein